MTWLFFLVHSASLEECSVGGISQFVFAAAPSRCVDDALSEIILQRVCSAEAKIIKFYSTKHLRGAETPRPSVAQGSLLHNYDFDGFSSVWF